MKEKAPYINGERLVDRADLYKYETPLYKVATSGRWVVVYYAGDSIPAYLQEVNNGQSD